MKTILLTSLTLFASCILSAQQIKFNRAELKFGDSGSLDWPEVTAAPNEQIRSFLQKEITTMILSSQYSDAPVVNSVQELKQLNGKTNPKVVGLLGDCPECTLDETVNLTEAGNVVSLTYSFSEYCCGAHGMYSSVTKSYDIRTAKELVLADVFKAGFDVKAKELGEKLLRKSENIDPEQSLSDYGYEGFYEGMVLSENYEFGPSGIYFYYNPYEVGPWSMPPPAFTIPYADVMDFIKPDGALAPLLKTNPNIGSGLKAVNGTFKGNIRGDLKITLTLSGTTDLSGNYFYQSQGPDKKISLTGKRNGNNITLSESVNGKVTGTFDLTLSADGKSLSGFWIGTKGQKLTVLVNQ